MQIEQPQMMNLKIDRNGHIKKKSIIMICCNCGTRTRVEDMRWRQCPRCKQSRYNFLIK